MRILQIINSLSTGGAEKLVVDSIPIFKEKNLEMDLLLLDNAKTPFYQQLDVSASCKILSSKYKSVYNPMHIFSIMKIIKHYDIIHAHLFPTLYWLAIAKLFSFSKPRIIYTEHSTSNRRRDKIFFKLLDRLIYKQYDKIITIAEEVDTKLKWHLNSRDNSKFTLINNGINVSLYMYSLPYPKSAFFDENDKFLIQISSFRRPKDQETLIKSLALLPANVKLLLVGAGPLQSYCEELVAQYKLQKRIKFLGNRMDVPRLLKTSDLVILSSKYEGLSLSSIEGMASGRPFIASNVAGLREIVGGYGVLFECGNERELAEKIKYILNNKDYYNEITEKCMLKAAQFDIQLMAKRYRNIYEALL